MIRAGTSGRLLALASLVLLVSCDASSGGATSDEGRGSGVPESWQELEVRWHVDGDTVGVRALEDGPAGRRGEETPVRLLEIDTPEVHPERECFGPEAAAELARLLPRGSSVWGERDEELRDPYGRTLLYLYADVPGDGDPGPVMVNLHLVRNGYAESVLFRPNDLHIDEIRRAEQQARSDGVGLWGACR